MNIIVGKNGLKALAQRLADEYSGRYATLLNELSELERKKLKKRMKSNYRKMPWNELRISSPR